MKDDEVLSEIKWTVADVKAAFKNRYGREPSDGQLQDCIENLDTKSLEDRSIEFGWSFIYDALI
jgi:hypothetical protein